MLSVANFRFKTHKRCLVTSYCIRNYLTFLLRFYVSVSSKKRFHFAFQMVGFCCILVKNCEVRFYRFYFKELHIKLSEKLNNRKKIPYLFRTTLIKRNESKGRNKNSPF